MRLGGLLLKRLHGPQPFLHDLQDARHGHRRVRLARRDWLRRHRRGWGGLGAARGHRRRCRDGGDARRRTVGRVVRVSAHVEGSMGLRHVRGGPRLGG